MRRMASTDHTDPAMTAEPVYGALARAEALAAGDSGWMNVKQWPPAPERSCCGDDAEEIGGCCGHGAWHHGGATGDFRTGPCVVHRCSCEGFAPAAGRAS
jgi:hypothetical protein